MYSLREGDENLVRRVSSKPRYQDKALENSDAEQSASGLSSRVKVLRLFYHTNAFMSTYGKNYVKKDIRRPKKVGFMDSNYYYYDDYYFSMSYCSVKRKSTLGS